MCDDTWQRLDADFDKIIGSLKVAAGGAAGEALTPAYRHRQGGETATILEFGKRGGGVNRPQWVLQGGENVEVGETSTRQTVPLRYRR